MLKIPHPRGVYRICSAPNLRRFGGGALGGFARGVALGVVCGCESSYAVAAGRCVVWGGGAPQFYLLPHKSLSDGLRIANRKRTKTKGHPFVQMTVLPPTDTRQKIILLNSYCNRYLTRQI